MDAWMVLEAQIGALYEALAVRYRGLRCASPIGLVQGPSLVAFHVGTGGGEMVVAADTRLIVLTPTDVLAAELGRYLDAQRWARRRRPARLRPQRRPGGRGSKA